MFSKNRLCSTGTFSTSCVLQELSLKQFVICKHIPYKTRCVLQPLIYETRCVLQAFHLQNKLCSAATLTTKQVVFCMLYATQPTHHREFEQLQMKCICHSANTICPLHKHLIVQTSISVRACWMAKGFEQVTKQIRLLYLYNIMFLAKSN
jgi:hypothetical protein